jgi:hypothetical protein
MLAPHVLVGFWGLLIAFVWLPFWQWAWRTHGIRRRELALDPTPFFDATVGIGLGAAVAYVIVRLATGPSARRWLLFMGAFVVSLMAVGGPVEWNGLGLVLLSPLFLGFGASAATVALYLAKTKGGANVP